MPQIRWGKRDLSELLPAGGLASDAQASVKEDLEAAADGERVVGARRKSVRELAGVGAGAEVVGAGRARGESQAMYVKSSKV